MLTGNLSSLSKHWSNGFQLHEISVYIIVIIIIIIIILSLFLSALRQTHPQHHYHYYRYHSSSSPSCLSSLAILPSLDPVTTIGWSGTGCPCSPHPLNDVVGAKSLRLFGEPEILHWSWKSCGNREQENENQANGAGKTVESLKSSKLVNTLDCPGKNTINLFGGQFCKGKKPRKLSWNTMGS